VQNKLHFATHLQTASEVIYNRANADQDFMGLTTFKGDLPALDEVRETLNNSKFRTKKFSPIKRGNFLDHRCHFFTLWFLVLPYFT